MPTIEYTKPRVRLTHGDIEDMFVGIPQADSETLVSRRLALWEDLSIMCGHLQDDYAPNVIKGLVVRGWVVNVNSVMDSDGKGLSFHRSARVWSCVVGDEAVVVYPDGRVRVVGSGEAMPYKAAVRGAGFTECSYHIVGEGVSYEVWGWRQAGPLVELFLSEWTKKPAYVVNDQLAFGPIRAAQVEG